MAETNPPTLGYAAPDIFFDGEYRFRTPSALIVGIASLGTGVIVVLSKLVYRIDVPAVIVGIFGGSFVLVGAGCLWAFLANRSQIVRLTADGARLGSRFWAWRDLESVGAVRRSGDDLHLYVQARGRALRYVLVTTPPLTAGQYGNLRTTLDQFFALSGLDVKTLDPVRDVSRG